MRNMIFLLTKDCMSTEAVSVYGNKYWETPNINALAEKGTIFRKHYAAAASTVMSLTAMLTGKNLYEFNNRKVYEPVEQEEFPSIFTYFQGCGYETHLIWDNIWTKEAWPLIREFGNEDEIILHSIDIAQRTGAGKVGKLTDEVLERNEEATQDAVSLVKTTIEGIDRSKKLFIWVHLPHVLKGRTCYMDDMDAFDEIVGYVRQFAGDENIFLSTDHGHMNLHKGLVGYGFNVYEPIIHIPLITPRIDGKKEIYDLTSNIDIPFLLKGQVPPKHDYIISDTQYYGQPNRITAVVTNRFKFIYNKGSKTEELYDLLWDPEENYNIVSDGYFDENRRKKLMYIEYFFYPYREDALNALEHLRRLKDSIWKDCYVEPLTQKTDEEVMNSMDELQTDYRYIVNEKGLLFAWLWKVKKALNVLFLRR